MGYYTQHTLEILENESNKTEEEIIAELRDENDDAEYAIEANGKCQEETKWYDCTDDMIKFSLKHPKVLFLMHCNGEDSERWRIYVQNGKYANIESTFPVFNKNQLK